MNLTIYIILVVVLGLACAMFAYFLLTPNEDAVDFYVSSDSNINPGVRNAINVLGGDILSLVPKDTRKRSIQSKKLDDLFRAAANPWSLTKQEFFVIRILYGIIGLAAGLLLSVVLYKSMGILICVLITFGGTYAGYRQPLSVYEAEAKRRVNQFRSQLPEAIDYLAMALSAGSNSLPRAFERVIGYLPEGVVREEFERVVKDVNSGQSMEYALNELAKRAPSESINAFVKSMNNANMLSVPMTELLRQRSLASRKDLEAEMDRKITRMPTTIMIVLAPVILFCLVVIVLAPHAANLLGM